MSTANDYYYYITNEDGVDKICIVYDDGAGNRGNYDGDATIYYTKLADTDTTLDINSPTIEGRWHWALVWGALMLMGYTQFAQNYQYYIRLAKATKSKVNDGTMVLFWY